MPWLLGEAGTGLGCARLCLTRMRCQLRLLVHAWLRCQTPDPCPLTDPLPDPSSLSVHRSAVRPQIPVSTHRSTASSPAPSPHTDLVPAPGSLSAPGGGFAKGWWQQHRTPGFHTLSGRRRASSGEGHWQQGPARDRDPPQACTGSCPIPALTAGSEAALTPCSHTLHPPGPALVLSRSGRKSQAVSQGRAALTQEMANTDSSQLASGLAGLLPSGHPSSSSTLGSHGQRGTLWIPASSPSCLQNKPRPGTGRGRHFPGRDGQCFWNLYDLETSYANTAWAGKVPWEGPRSTGHGAPFGPSPIPTQAAQALPAPHQAMSSCAGPAGIIPTRV